jgi:RimJ/RimL family protein N-acetyltransferase
MNFPTEYTCLTKNKFLVGDYKIVPIRFEDRLDIMKWRNEQLFHLRQTEVLTEKSQDNYFKKAVASLFEQQNPNQVLFSYFKNEIFIGYGGLVHINWIDKNAEISFVLNTELEKEQFEYHWLNYLKLIDQLAFEELQFHKVFVYAFDLRPHLYQAIEKGGFTKEAVLKEHCFYDNKFIDVVIHSKIRK